MEFREELEQRVLYVEDVIKKYLPKEEGFQKTVIEAMNYSVMAGGKLATRTIKNMVMRCAESLKDTYERIRLTMITLGLIHCDEIGSHMDGKNCWVHVASDQDYTYLTINQKRGQIGMDAADVLPHARGIIVHDCWGAYLKYQDVIHTICCAHLLRELNGVIENHPEQTWVARFKKLLLYEGTPKENFPIK